MNTWTYYIDPAAGDDANDGSCWALAKRTVQGAINAAAGVGGDEPGVGIVDGVEREAGSRGQ